MAKIKQVDILQRLFAVARNDAALTALVPADNIKGHLREDGNLPWVRGRINIASDWSCKTQLGYEVTFTFDVWSQEHDDGESAAIADALIDAFDRQDLGTVSGQHVYTHHESTSFMIEPDGQTHHAVVDFRVLVTSNN